MGQIIGLNAKPKRANLNALSLVPTPASGEIILVSSDNNMTADGQGIFDYYIKGDGTTAAINLPLIPYDKNLIDDEKVIAQTFAIHNEKFSEFQDEIKTKLGDEEELTIAAALNNLNDRILEKSDDGDSEQLYSANDKLTIANSDIITAIGSSFGTGFCNVAGKDWMAKLSLFSDYQIRRLSQDGGNYSSILRGLRNGTLGFKGKYALLACNENTSMDMNLRLMSLVKIAEYLKTVGAEPILATSYTDFQYQSALFKQYASDNNFMFWDAAKYCSLIRDARGGNGDSGRHLGTRNSQMTTDAYLPYLYRMERPNKSLKVFKVRNSIDTSSLDNLLFINNEERAKIFKEAFIGGNCIADPTKVDAIAQTNNSAYPNEYSSLEGGGIIIESPILLSAVIPIDSQNIKSLNLSFESTKDVDVYVLNRRLAPYPEVVSYARFSVESGSGKPSQGSIYTYNSTQYTVKSVVDGENDYFYTMYCSPSLSGTIGSGILTKTSGNGPETINFVLGEVSTLSQSNAVQEDTVGHWELIGKAGSAYYLNNSQLKSCIAFDKVHFLIIPSASCNISEISINSAGDAYKKSFTRVYYNYDTTYWNEDELVQEPVFTTGTQLNKWNNNGNAIVPVADYEGKYPIGCGGCVHVDNTNSMESETIELNSGGKYILEVWSRYFPPIYTDGTGNDITPDSYDYETLRVKVFSSSAPTNTDYYATYTDRIGTYWKISQFAIDIYTPTSIGIIVNSGEKELEICKVSLKKIN